MTFRWQSSIAAGCAAWWLAVATAAEPVVRSLADLREIEDKVAVVYERVMPSTVALLSEATGSSGSGVVVREDGLIATAAHVLMGAEQVRVLFPDGREMPGRVLGMNFTKDLGFVQIQRDGGYPAVALGSSDAMAVGDWVLALGHSAGFDPVRTPPLRFGRVVSKGPGDTVTSDCTLIGGDSGGPLFDLDGRLVGIHSSIGGALNNNNHSGIDGLRRDWQRLEDGESWGRLSLNPLANPDTPVLGFVMGRGRGGVPVRELAPGSPAGRAGLRPGDVVVGLDDRRVEDAKSLLVELARRKPGDQVAVRVQRGGRELEFQVMLARRDDFYAE